MKKIIKYIVYCVVLSLLGLNAYTQTSPISRAEYFFDGPDPGLGQAYPLNADEGENTFSIDNISTLSPGFHTLYYRVADENEVWSMYEARKFYIKEPLAGIHPPKIVSAEYFFDGPDLGLGAGIPLDIIDPNITDYNDFVIDKTISVTNLSQGFHTLYFRVKDENEVWSMYEARKFFIVGNVNCSYDIQKFEYYVDQEGTNSGIFDDGLPTQDSQFEMLISVDGLSMGSHTIFVFSVDDCGTSTLVLKEKFTINESVKCPEGSNLIVSSTTACYQENNGTATVEIIEGTAPFTYTWSNDVVINSDEQTALLQNLFAGTYTVTVVDALGCTSSDLVNVNEFVQIKTNILSKTDVLCNGKNTGDATVEVIDGTSTYSYLWSDNQTGNEAINLFAGDYFVTVTDANSCSATASVTILEPLPISISSNSEIKMPCANSCDGIISLDVTGGVSPYSFDWNISEVGSISALSNLCSGNYNVVVTDANNCTLSVSQELIENLELVANAETVFSPLGITLNVSGGSSPYSYAWSTNGLSGNSDGNPDGSLLNLPEEGNYIITITDANGCNVQMVQSAFLVNRAQANWYFGKYGSIDFNTGSAVPNDNAAVHNTINSLETCVTESDPKTGKLLFYSDGVTVWNDQHKIINPIDLATNIQINLRDGLSNRIRSTSQIVSVPDPANNDNYYIFIPIGVATNSVGFKYAYVRNTPQGYTVSEVNQDIPTFYPDRNISEMITAIPHCNGKDYWIITTDGEYNPEMFVYLLSEYGITNPFDLSIKTPSVFTHRMYFGNSRIGYLKASPDGKKLALATLGGSSLFDFDCATGTISNERSLRVFDENNTIVQFAAVTFSPNSSMLYLTGSKEASNIEINHNLYKYDITNDLFSSVPLPFQSRLQLSPQLDPNEAKIFISNYQKMEIFSIENPNSLLTEIIISDPLRININAITTSLWNFPNMIDTRKSASEINPDFNVSVNGNNVSVNTEKCLSGYVHSWDFGDGSSEIVQNVGEISPYNHSYSKGGVYTITLKLLRHNGANLEQIYTVQHIITIVDIYVAKSLLSKEETILPDENNKKEEYEVLSNSISKQNLIVYPNPSTGNINLKFDGFDDNDHNSLDIIIKDIQGRTIFQQEKMPFEINVSINKFVDLSLPDGMYFIQIKLKDSEINKKIIVKK